MISAHILHLSAKTAFAPFGKLLDVKWVDLSGMCYANQIKTQPKKRAWYSFPKRKDKKSAELAPSKKKFDLFRLFRKDRAKAQRKKEAWA